MLCLNECTVACVAFPVPFFVRPVNSFVLKLKEVPVPTAAKDANNKSENNPSDQPLVLKLHPTSIKAQNVFDQPSNAPSASCLLEKLCLRGGKKGTCGGKMAEVVQLQVPAKAFWVCF
ncbi:hypothetical protein SAY86_008862 [Trapa natans]|uniref:Uncharacterized protein n=1 Tax=Trapa natans TaxID=22666 RepID=A0AAN7KDM1_TRANT|nr:hypothetical protein SAY86_008862 [Trapa natans]